MVDAYNCYQSFLYVSKHLFVKKTEWQKKLTARPSSIVLQDFYIMTLVTGLGSVLPGIGIVGGALSLGATLLDPKPSLKDLQKNLNEIKDELKSISEPDEELRRILEKTVLEEIKVRNIWFLSPLILSK